MKYSLYNNFVAYGDGVIAFNALSILVTSISERMFPNV